MGKSILLSLLSLVLLPPLAAGQELLNPLSPSPGIACSDIPSAQMPLAS
jgi:hypothetical protein